MRLARRSSMWPWKLAPVLLWIGLAAAEPARYSLPQLPALAAMTARATANLSPLTPRCFAYSARHHMFACFGHDPIFNMDHVGADDQATNLRIDVVGPKLSATWTLEAIGKRPTTKRGTVAAELARLGMRTLTTTPIQLGHKTWTKVGDQEIWFSSDFRDGDASYAYVGETKLRCADNTEVVLPLEMPYGESTWAFLAPDKAWIAIGMAGDHGGEGTKDFTLDTAVIDVAQTCRDHAAVMSASAGRVP